MSVDQFAPYDPPYMKFWKEGLTDPKPAKVKPKPRKKGKADGPVMIAKPTKHRKLKGEKKSKRERK